MYKHKNGVTLYKIEEEDLIGLKMLKDESWWGTHHISILNMYDQKKWFEDITSRNDILVLTAYLNDDRSFGNKGTCLITIDWINRSCDFSYSVYEQYRGKELGWNIAVACVDFIFEVLNLRRINTEVLRTNQASRRILNYAGLKEEGVRKEAVLRCGYVIDSIVLGLLYKDWVILDRVKGYDGCCNLIWRGDLNDK